MSNEAAPHTAPSRLAGSRCKGGKIVALGVFGGRPRVDMSIVGDRELCLIGTLMCRHEDYDQAVRWVASGLVQTGPLITRHFPFQQ